MSALLILIVQQARFKDGTRRITNITEVQDMEGDVVVLQDIFTFKQKGIEKDGKILGELVATGIRPRFYDKFQHLDLTYLHLYLVQRGGNMENIISIFFLFLFSYGDALLYSYMLKDKEIEKRMNYYLDIEEKYKKSKYEKKVKSEILRTFEKLQ